MCELDDVSSSGNFRYRHIDDCNRVKAVWSVLVPSVNDGWMSLRILKSAGWLMPSNVTAQGREIGRENIIQETVAVKGLNLKRPGFL